LHFDSFCCRYFDSHGSIYLAKCKAAGVTPNALAIPEGGHNTAGAGVQQAKLDGFVQQTPTWTKEGLVAHIVELIAVEDEVSVNIVPLFHPRINTTSAI
jgi:hypothetical protein